MKDKIKAFLVHLCISIVVATVTVFVVYGLWNPNPLHIAMGVTKIFGLILGIDLILGPILTFLVYKKDKKALKFDLAVIAILQLGAYCYGMYTVAISRPAYIAFDTLRFEVVQADTVLRGLNDNILPQYRSNRYLSPQWVAIRPTKSQQEQSERVWLEVSEAIAPSMQAKLYEPIETAYPIIKKRTQAISDLKKFNDNHLVDGIVNRHQDVVGFLPLKATATDMTVLVDKEGHVVEIVDLRPWK